MAKLTDRVKDRIANDPMRKFKQAQEAPEWLSSGGVWVGIVAVALAIGFVIFAGVTSDGPEEVVVAEEYVAPQQELNPHAVDEDDGDGESPEPSTGGSDNSSEVDPNSLKDADFTALDSISMPVETSSIDSMVPEGAANVARAGAQAMTSGDWSDIPTNKSPNDDRYLGVTVDFSTMRLTDPVGHDVDANKAFTFLFDGSDSDGTAVQFTVTSKWEVDTYQVVIF